MVLSSCSRNGGRAALVAAVLASTALAGRAAAPTPAPTLERVYIGTYTQSPSGRPGRGGRPFPTNSQGIYLATFNTKTLHLSPLTLAVKVVNPSYFIFSPHGRYAYSVNELVRFDGQVSGGVSSFAVDPETGTMKLLNQLPSGGTLPAFLSLDKTGHYLFVANYGTGNVSVFRRNPDGSIGARTAFWQHHGHSVNPMRQRGPHAHFAITSPDNRYLLSADLGLDQVLVEHFDAANGTLTPATPPYVSIKPGSGPRHLVFADHGRRVYLVSEMGATVTAMNYHHGALSVFQTVSSTPPGFRGANSGAEIALSPGGRFLYVSNRGSNTVAQFAIHPQSGRISLVRDVSTQGKIPRMFSLDLTGRFLWAANQNSANIVVFRRNLRTGALTPAGINVPLDMPVCVQFQPVR